MITLSCAALRVLSRYGASLRCFAVPSSLALSATGSNPAPKEKRQAKKTPATTRAQIPQSPNTNATGKNQNTLKIKTTTKTKSEFALRSGGAMPQLAKHQARAPASLAARTGSTQHLPASPPPPSLPHRRTNARLLRPALANALTIFAAILGATPQRSYSLRGAP